LICYAYRNYTKRAVEHLKLLFSLYFPCLWVMSVLLIMKIYHYRLYPPSFANDIFSTFINCTIFLAACAPLIYHLIKRQKLFSYIKARI
jgi:hypothetical protein